jgi:ABC-type lipoprotein export system ATPase subunit
MNIELNDIYYFASNSQKKNVCLLRSVSAFFPALKINAVMGPSGGGKSKSADNNY